MARNHTCDFDYRGPVSGGLLGILTGETLKKATTRDGTRSYGLIAVTGEFLGEVPGNFEWEFIDSLIDHRLLYGHGHPKSARHLRMDAEMSVALDKLGVDAGCVRRERGMTPLELMRRYCSDRKTTKKGYATIQNGRRVFHVEWFEHKTNSKLEFRQRNEAAS